jgi:hypothetical protein
MYHQYRPPIWTPIARHLQNYDGQNCARHLQNYDGQNCARHLQNYDGQNCAIVESPSVIPYGYKNLQEFMYFLPTILPCSVHKFFYTFYIFIPIWYNSQRFNNRHLQNYDGQNYNGHLQNYDGQNCARHLQIYDGQYHFLGP